LQLLVNKRNHQSVCFIPQFGAAWFEMRQLHVWSIHVSNFKDLL
jgi:hypothetical protein